MSEINDAYKNLFGVLESSIQNAQSRKLLERQLANDAMSQQLQQIQMAAKQQEILKQAAAEEAGRNALQQYINVPREQMQANPNRLPYDMTPEFNTALNQFLATNSGGGAVDAPIEANFLSGTRPLDNSQMRTTDYSGPTAGQPVQTMQPRPQQDVWKDQLNTLIQAELAGAKLPANISKLHEQMKPEMPVTWQDLGNGLKYTVVDRKPVFAPQEKTQEIWSAPEIMKVGGKTAVVQKSSTGQLKPIVQDAPKININTNSTPDLVESDARAIIQGNLAPSDISKRNGHDVKVRAKVRELSPNFNFNEANANAKYMKSDVMNRQYVNLEGVKQPIEELKVLGAQLENTQFKPFNKFVNTLKENTGNKEIVAYNAKRNSVIQELANAMRGAGISEGSINLELRNFDNAYSPQQIETAVNNTLEVIKAKQQAIRQKPYGGNNTPSAPKAGDIIKGYKFKGGNPADKNNWVKQ